VRSILNDLDASILAFINLRRRDASMRKFGTRLLHSIKKRTVGVSPNIVAERLDLVFAVPFKFPALVPKPAPTTGVMLHAFYLDQATIIKDLLQNVPFQFSTFITTDTAEKEAELRSMFANWTHGPVEVLVTANRGRDLGPRFAALRNVHSEFEFVLYVHTKKSLPNPEVKYWATELFQNLIGSRQTVLSIFSMFQANPRLGIVAPRYFPPIRPFVKWGPNFDNCLHIANQMNIQISERQSIDFPAGSMFWARTAALRPLLNLNLSTSDFDAERGQRNGTLAHAIERMFFFSCELAGFSWQFISSSGKKEKYEKIITPKSQEELSRALLKHERSLLTTRPKTPRIYDEPR
jgi:lipopolysaccharide biosynthesis protein